MKLSISTMSLILATLLLPTSAFTAGDATSSPTPSQSDSAIREEFLDRVNRLNNVAEEKEHWTRIYIRLGRHAQEVQGLLNNIVARRESTEKQGQRGASRGLRVKESILQKWLEDDELRRQLAVRQFAALQKLEDLDRDRNRQTVSIDERCKRQEGLEEEIRQIEHLRVLINFSEDVTEALREIQGEMISLEPYP